MLKTPAMRCKLCGACVLSCVSPNPCPALARGLREPGHRLQLVTMLSDLLEGDRRRLGLSVGQAPWRLGVKVREYRELGAGTGWPTFDAYDRAAELYGWPQTLVRGAS